MRSPTLSSFLILCFFAVTLLGLASASPFGANNEDEASNAVLLGRAATTNKSGKCKNDKQCDKGYHCANSTCVPDLTAPNGACTADSQCQSGECESPSYGCRDASGNTVSCPERPGDDSYYSYTVTSNICRRFPIGHTCANQGECEYGVCKGGKCQENKVGKSCSTNDQCSQAGVLCIKGKCTQPKKSSLYPREVCGSDDQCLSGDCASDTVYKDTQGVNNGIVTTAPTKRYAEPGSGTCNYLQDMATGCRDLFDCALQRCEKGKCLFGSTGDSCTINYQCYSKVCDTTGHCIDPAPGANFGTGQVCYNGTQCLSGVCSSYPKYQIGRPSLGNPAVLAYENDFACDTAPTGGKCRVDSDCSGGGTCTDGVCEGGNPYYGYGR
ncbi:hypothetical protein V8E36_002263 [Tilletia maclaganii]